MLPILTNSLISFSFEGLENALFNLRSERAKAVRAKNTLRKVEDKQATLMFIPFTPKSDQCQISPGASWVHNILTMWWRKSW